MTIVGPGADWVVTGEAFEVGGGRLPSRGGKAWAVSADVGVRVIGEANGELPSELSPILVACTFPPRPSSSEGLSLLGLSMVLFVGTCHPVLHPSSPHPIGVPNSGGAESCCSQQCVWELIPTPKAYSRRRTGGKFGVVSGVTTYPSLSHPPPLHQDLWVEVDGTRVSRALPDVLRGSMLGATAI